MLLIVVGQKSAARSVLYVKKDAPDLVHPAALTYAVCDVILGNARHVFR